MSHPEQAFTRHLPNRILTLHDTHDWSLFLTMDGEKSNEQRTTVLYFETIAPS